MLSVKAAIRMGESRSGFLKRGKLTVEEIAEDTGLSVTEVEQLAGLQAV